MTEEVFIFPSSFAQQRLWFLDQLEPGSAFYNIPAAVRLKGMLDVAALRRSLNEVVRRHETLRTRFEVVDAQPMQVIAPSLALAAPLNDLQHLPEGKREAEAVRLATDEARRPFDLGVAPLLRATLLRLSADEHILTLTMHHIISDGWSVGVLIREIAALYEAFTTGRPSPLPDLTIQYADFTDWERDWMQGDVLSEQLAHWEQKLAGELPVLELPADRPRPRVPSRRGGLRRFTLPRDLTESLKAIARREGATLFMTLLAAFKVLLQRYTGQEDVIVGVPNANRNQVETEALIGLFVNTLVLRTDLSGGLSFSQLLGRVRETVLEADAHREAPFEKLVERLQPERNLGQNPLFQIMFIFQSARMPLLELPGLSLSLLEVDAAAAKFDLLLSLQETPEGLTGLLQYSTDLFDDETVGRLAAHYGNLLVAAAADPGRRISSLPLLSPEEEHEMLVGWNETGDGRAPEQCLHELFAEQAARTPDAVAVVADDGRLTYAELEGHSNRLARFLQSMGIGPESFVGVMLERGVWMVASLLAVHKAGGAYVPLDPAYPPTHLAYTLADSRASVLLTSRRLYAQVLKEQAALAGEDGGLSIADAQVVFLDEAREDVARLPATSPASGVCPQNLAYVIYTSGSTGRPKGVAIEHRNASAMVYWARDHFASPHLAGVLASTSLCFDLSVFELFVTLSTGGKVVVADDALHLPTLKAAGEVTLVNTVPSAMTELLRLGAIPDSVRVVNLAGEALAQTLVEQVYEQTGAEEVWNLYGPSEDTTYSTYALIERGSRRTPPIGRPITNSRAYVLDAHLQPVPVGVAGELWLGGAGVARGYLNRPGLTAERFTPDPFGAAAGGRLYRTGDVARRGAGGELEYLGRLDTQVKLRGFRIELGEIEAVLCEQAGVAAAAVVAVAGAGGPRLMAYVAAAGGAAAVGAGELRAHLRGRLPSYMSPTQILVLDALPLTPNGKVDRKALKALKALPAPAGSGSGAGGRALTAVEEVVAGVWREVLGVGEAGAEDDFFELGGHSLLATKAVSRLRDIFHVELALRTMFEAPTVAGLARSVELARGGGEALQTPPVVRVARDGEIPLSFSQQRLWFLDELEPGNAFYNLSTALRIDGPLDAAALGQAFKEIVRRHEALRTTFVTVAGRPVQVISTDVRLSLPVTDLGGMAGAEREAEARRLAEKEAQLPFDLVRGPLLRTRLLRLDAQRHVALLTMHHIVSDGWSKGVLMRELAALYEAYSANRPSPLPELPIQYADFSYWQRDWLQGEALERQLSYWKGQLAGAPSVLALPADMPRPAVQTFRGATHDFTLAAGLAAELNGLSRREGVTLFMTLLAAFSALLTRHTGQEDLVVGTAIANRDQAATEDLIGMFVNTLPMRVDTSGDPGFVDLLGRVREVALGAYAHQALPFEKLIDELRLKRDTSRSPLVQVMLILQNAPTSKLELPGLTLTPFVSASRAAKLDLILSITEDVGVLRCALEYNTDLFKAATVERLAAHFRTLLEGIAADPRRRLSELPIMTDDERRRLREWNVTGADFERGYCIHELFEAQAAKTPDAPAVTYEDESLTYAELNRRANRLARRLQSMGVGPEVRVGICVGRGVEMIVGLLGILKAGGVYVPMDVDYPRERLSFMLEDARVGVLLTEERLLPKLPAHRVRTVCLDSERGDVGEQSDENPAAGALPENLAYVIYTSGSTGRPKGVCVSHRNVAHLFAAIYPSLGLGESEVWTLFHSYAFDFSVWELWGALLHGGRLVVVPLWTARTPDAFRELLKTRCVTVLSQTPSAFIQWAGAGRGETRLGEELSLRLIVLGGEALPSELARELANAGLPVWNFYGPTEATVWSAVHRLRTADETPNAIGRPIQRMQLHVLDRLGSPVPVGVAGELHLSGEGLSRGYLNRPGLTAEKFIPHSSADEPGARLYRTGDLSRYLPDGRVEFLGRIDEQVKVRGYRIEPGEIEAALCEHEAVREALVVARATGPGEHRLVAYVVEEEGRRVVVGGLRAALKERLPDYMIPSAFVVLEALPLTPNGKLDRRSLPAPGAERSEAGGSYQPPGTPEEVALARAWALVLGAERIGIHDNFFDLGGDSIRCIQARVETQKQGFDFSVQQLFQHQTIFELAGRLRVFEADARVEAQTPPFGLVAASERARLPEAVEDAYPLAKLQQGMLFHSELSPDTSVYHDILSFHLRAPFDSEALRAALRESVARHAVLRTSFDLINFGEPLQLVLSSVDAPLSSTDLRHLPTEAQERRLAEWVAAEKRNHFDWAKPPFVRFAVFRRSEETFQFGVSFHHAILDGWSLASLLTELFTTYSTLLEGAESPRAPRPPLRLTYRDFIALERQAVESLEARHYWDDKLSGSVATIWPEPETPEVSEGGGRSCGEEFGPEFVEKLRELARLASVPLKSVLLAAHLKVISVLGGSGEVLTGLVSNGRPEGADGERVLGLFLNTVPLRVSLRGGAWIDLIRSAHDAEQEMFPFRRYPLAELQRERGGRPLFEITFNFVHFHVVEALRDFAGLEVLGAESFGRTNFPVGVSFTLDPATSRLSLHIECNAEKADEGRLRDAADYFRRVLAAMVDQPLGRYESFSPLSETELLKLRAGWNDTEADYPRALCLHQMFEAQAGRTPEATAVLFEDERLSYGELDARANQLARRLQSMGVGPEVRVGILMERSVEMAVALLGVLKAGGAYVPLDPAYPAERLSFMLSDSRAAVVLTQERVRASLEAVLRGYGGDVLAVDAQWPAVAGESRDRPANRVTAENLIYVIYTSGSTGQPKGAMLSHRGIVSCVLWMQETYRLDESDGFLMKTSLNFDPSVWEFFWPLGVGARVVIARPGEQADTAYLLETITRRDVTCAYFVPSMLRLFLDDPRARAATSLKRVICGGEKLPAETVARFFDTLRAELHHSYGPTETSIAATESRCERESPRRVVTIGRPLSNTELHLLDPHMQPVPVGVGGELYIGGECLGRGYLSRPDLTAEKFVPHPSGRRPGARLYRTGDLVRYLRDGEVEFLGRVDQQVKVRGYRIEPGEVEAALIQHPQVGDCLVAVRDDAAHDKQLVAYVVAAGQGGGEAAGAPGAGELRRHLKERLPGYMIPSAFVVLGALPVLPNGKVDRRALPAPEAGRVESSADYVAPRTMIEEVVAGVWQEVLKVERVGVRDDFFELGGHSLLVTQAASRLREAFRTEMPLRRIFEHPTVESLAARLDSERREGPQTTSPPIEPASREGELELSFAQQRLWFLHQLDPDSPAFNVPVAARLTGGLEVAALELALGEIVRRHEALRTVFHTAGGRVVQVVTPPAAFRLPVTDLSGRGVGEREAETLRLAREEARRPFDLRRGPLVRASLLRLGEREHVLLLTMHHIVSDAWSIGVLIRETVALYESFSAGRPSPLADLPIQYADYATWQNQWLQGEVLEKQLAYWRGRLGGGAPALNLPTDRERPALQAFRGAAHTFSPPAALVEGLKALSRRQSVTPFMTLLASFKLLLFHYAEQTDVVIGANVAGRTRIETEGLIGFFVNMLVLRTDLSGDPTFSELLSRVRETALGAYAHQDVPYEKLSEELKAGRAQSRSPLQVAITFDNTPREAVELPGLSLKLLDIKMETARHDLALDLADGPRGLTGSFQYNTDLYNASTIGRMAEQYESLLRRVVEQPEARLSSLRAFLIESDRGRQALRREGFREARSRGLRDAKLKRPPSQPSEGELVR